jgi:hypothetical protein
MVLYSGIKSCSVPLFFIGILSRYLICRGRYRDPVHHHREKKII